MPSLKEILWFFAAEHALIQNESDDSFKKLMLKSEAQLKALIIAQAPPKKSEETRLPIPKFYKNLGYNQAREDYIKAIERLE